MNSNLKTETMDAAGDMGVERREAERRSAAQMIYATNYELAIRERDDALARVAQLEAQQAPNQSAELTSIDTTEFLGRAIAASAEAMTSGPGKEWKSFIAHIELWAARRALAAVPAQQQASTVPAGWRAVIDQARDSICAGGLAENRQHERSIVEPHLDGVYDELEALEKEAAPAHALTDAEIDQISAACTSFKSSGANPFSVIAELDRKAFAHAIAAHVAKKD